MSEPNESTQRGDFTRAGEEVPHDSAAPESIGRYRVSGVIGRGAFGTVYRAVDELLDRQVAIKVARRFPSKGADSSKWNSEAQMAAMLDHPHIVPVYDVGSTEEFPLFVVSRFIEGIDLRERLQQRPPSLDQTLIWMIEIAGALQHAHQKGIVHRDVKPSNILIETNDRAWLTDFGLAIRDDDMDRQADGKRLVGTYSYMSPEQARGEGHLVDGRADIFALGIVLYELLLGKRPFTGGSSKQLLQSIVRAEPQPLRQLNANISVELERICMKALAQRLSDRYSSGVEMADDLRRVAQCHHTGESTKGLSRSGDPTLAKSAAAAGLIEEPRVVPKGLRAFDEHDQDFFLKLVPGVRDAQGVPEVIRRLKSRIEARLLNHSFRVGLIYGASGSGKSSLIRAGLIPLLDDSVDIAYVEANANHTESRLLSAISGSMEPAQQAGTLVDAMAAIRKGVGKGDRKVVVILDQFEQWLHAHPMLDDAELVHAIRQCDGVNLQCLVLIRDDFWMAATRFFHELDIRLIQDVNSMAVDRFDLRHARFVLSEFGRAYGCLPDHPAALNREQQDFVHALVDTVAEEGKVISVHLVVVAQMLKSRDWNRKTLAGFTSAAGVDLNFLDATFHDSIASPPHRAMEVPARAVLAELLPEMGSDIKGQMKDAAQLREISGLNERDFEELVQALDGELRLITPTAAISPEPARGSSAIADGVVEATRYYQLTHDFLVPPLREWLTRHDRQTPRGRALLRLRELTQYWQRKRETRFLPNSFEYLRILALTTRAQRSADERQLMAEAKRYHGYRWALVAALAALVAWAAMGASHRNRKNLAVQEANLGVQRLLASDAEHVLESISKLRPIHTQAMPILQAIVADPARSTSETLAARLALVDSDPSQTKPLVDALLIGDVEQVILIVERLRLRLRESTGLLWRVVQSEPVEESRWLRAAFALAQLDPTDAKWAAHAARLSRTIVNQGTPLVVEMAPGFANISEYLSGPVQAFFAAPEPDNVRLNAAILLSKCLQPTDAPLSDLLSTATPNQFELLLPIALADPAPVMMTLRRELVKNATPTWPVTAETDLGNRVEIDDETLAELEGFESVVTSTFVMCQRLPWERFTEFSEKLSEFGYGPERVRAYRFENRNWIAAIWLRDQRQWRFTRHRGSDEIAATQTEMRQIELFPADITVIPESEVVHDEIEYGVLWTSATESMVDARLYADLAEEDHQTRGWGPLNEGGYLAKSNLKARDSKGRDRYSSVRWRVAVPAPVDDAWSDSQFEYESRDLDGWQQTDVRMNPVGEFDEHDISYGAVWCKGGTMQSKVLTRLPHEDHLKQSRLLADEDFRPVSVSVVFDANTDRLVAASVWHRPFVADEDKNALASRQANALIALLRLGDSDTLWPFLESRPDSRLRSFLIDRMAAFGTDPLVLLNRLTIETNESRKFAIMAALAPYRPEQLPIERFEPLRERIRRWGMNDPSAAIHAICSYLAFQWKWEDIHTQIVSAPTPPPSSGHDAPTWYQTGQGQTMVAISGPVEFSMGSPEHEPFRESHLEDSIDVRIPRSFAIGATEVTVQQFQRYNSVALHAADYTLSKNCPITSVSWYDAMNYCRWLSEQEGIAEDQMCYPSLSDMQAQLDATDTVTLPDDFLQRTGYRLPTEAEWEYCARALTTTPRHFGSADELLTKYAWTTESSTVHSQVRFHPVQQLLPNDFGLFDTLGNVMECCETRLPPETTPPVLIDERVQTNRSRLEYGVLRGSAVFYIPTTMRSAKREEARLDAHHPYMGLRIARTLPTTPASTNP